MEGWIEILKVCLWPVLVFLIVVILAIIFRKPLGQLIQSILKTNIPAKVLDQYYMLVKTAAEYFSTKAAP